MKSLSEIPEHIKQTFTVEEKRAIELFSPDELKELEAYFQDETGQFDCIGFVGPGGKVTKPASIEKYNALLVLENRVRRELAGQIGKLS